MTELPFNLNVSGETQRNYTPALTSAVLLKKSDTQHHHCQPPVKRLCTETLFLLAFFSKGVAQHLPPRIKARTPRWRKAPSVARRALPSWVLTWRARQKHPGCRRHQTNWIPGGVWNTWPWKKKNNWTFGDFCRLLCRVRLAQGNFWRKETGGATMWTRRWSRASSRCANMSFLGRERKSVEG